MQTQLLAIKLRFTSPLHLGRGSEDLDRTETIYHSDSLKAAIYAVGINIFPTWNNNAEYFHNNFRISSCFPFSGNDLFLPRPFIELTIEPQGIDETVRSKKVKKIEYLSWPIFKEAVKFRYIKIDKDQISPDGRFIFSRNSTNVFKTEAQQRVQVNFFDPVNSTQPFYADRLYFEKESGLYFLLQCDNPKLLEELFVALAMLGEYGIGTDRTVGNGFFEFNKYTDVTPIDWNIPQNPSQAVALGLYLPQKNELYQSISLDQSSWNLIRRGGYIAGANNEEKRKYLRNEIFMFSEGSCFTISKPLNGKIVDLKSDETPITHPVYRDGQCLFYYI